MFQNHEVEAVSKIRRIFNLSAKKDVVSKKTAEKNGNLWSGHSLRSSQGMKTEFDGMFSPKICGVYFTFCKTVPKYFDIVPIRRKQKQEQILRI